MFERNEPGNEKVESLTLWNESNLIASRFSLSYGEKLHCLKCRQFFIERERSEWKNLEKFANSNVPADTEKLFLITKSTMVVFELFPSQRSVNICCTCNFSFSFVSLSARELRENFSYLLLLAGKVNSRSTFDSTVSLEPTKNINLHKHANSLTSTIAICTGWKGK